MKAWIIVSVIILAVAAFIIGLYFFQDSNQTQIGGGDVIDTNESVKIGVLKSTIDKCAENLTKYYSKGEYESDTIVIGLENMNDTEVIMPLLIPYNLTIHSPSSSGTYPYPKIYTYIKRGDLIRTICHLQNNPEIKNKVRYIEPNPIVNTGV